MTKQQLIQGIIKAQGKRHAEVSYLKTKTVKELTDMYHRWNAIASVTEKEIRRNCDVSFIK